MSGATLFFDEPLYTGSSVTSSLVPSSYPVAVDGRPYVIELSMYERQTVERLRQPFDQSNEPGEHSLNTQGPWLRSAARWDHGAGQDFWDAEDSDRFRFRESKGIDIWTTERRAQLLHDTREIRNTSGTNLKCLGVGDYLYVVDGNDVLHTNAPDTASPSFTDAVIEAGDAAGSVSDITTDGVVVYAALGANGIHKTTLGASSSSSLSTQAATLVEFANGRLIAANAAVLYDVSNGGTATVVKTHYQASFTWTAVTGSPLGIYAMGNSDRGEFYFIGFDDATGGLAAAIPAGSLPRGEMIHAAMFYGGVVILGTSRGLRLAEIVNNAGLSVAPVIEAPGAVLALDVDGEDVWFSWANYDADSTGLGRARLSILLAGELVPAYASDLMADEQGNVTGIASLDGRRYFAVDGKGFYAEFEELVESGVIYSGWINFSTTEAKVPVSISVRHDELEGSVSVALGDEMGGVTTVGASTEQGSVAPSGPFGASSEACESCEVVITLARDADDDELGPLFRRWTFRALVAPVRVDEVLLPIILTENVDIEGPAGTRTVRFNPEMEFLFLKSLESSAAPVRYQEGSRSETMYVESVRVPAYESRQWTPDRTFPEGIVWVHLVGLEPIA